MYREPRNGGDMPPYRVATLMRDAYVDSKTGQSAAYTYWSVLESRKARSAAKTALGDCYDWTICS